MTLSTPPSIRPEAWRERRQRGVAAVSQLPWTMPLSVMRKLIAAWQFLPPLGFIRQRAALTIGTMQQIFSTQTTQYKQFIIRLKAYGMADAKLSLPTTSTRRPTMNAIYQNTGTHYPRCITRLSYLIRWVCFLLGTFVASQLMDTSSVILTGSGVALLLLLFISLFRWVLIPRLHDMGLEPAWAWSLLFFVHSVNFLFLLALLFVPTNAFAKRRYIY